MCPVLRRSRYGLALSILLLAATPGVAAPLPSELLGAWASHSVSGNLVRLEPERIVQLSAGKLKVWGIEGYESGKLAVRSGVLESWKASLAHNALKLEHGSKTESYTRLQKVPAELELLPATVGPTGEIQPARLEAVQKELAERSKKGQEVRMDPGQSAKMDEVDGDNLRYIRSLVAELGWIDVDRFGSKASVDAFLLVQHSGDLRLLMAVLPLIENDAKRYPDYAQPYTLLYDRLQIKLGKKQRFGTQLDQDAQGMPFVLPLEDPARVDEFLKDLKLPPLSEYLATASKYLYDGKPIRLPRTDE